MSNVFSRNSGFFAKAAGTVVVVGVLVGYSGWASAAAAADAAVQEQITQAQRAASRGSYPTDGTFTGTAQGYGGPVTCQVVIDNGYISEVDIADASHEDAEYLEQAQSLTGTIADAQTTSVDTVSGATVTSAGILNAATQALQQSIDGAGAAGAADGSAGADSEAPAAEEGGE